MYITICLIIHSNVNPSNYSMFYFQLRGTFVKGILELDLNLIEYANYLSCIIYRFHIIWKFKKQAFVLFLSFFSLANQIYVSINYAISVYRKIFVSICVLKF